MEIQKKHLMGIVAGILVDLSAVVFLRTEKFFWFIFIIGLVIVSIPFLFSLLFEQGRQKEKEERFLEFTRDLVENVKSGTPINRAILNLRTRDYGALSKHVEKLANQVSMGIILNSALSTFAKETKSTVIARSVALISEAQRAGGKIDTILESIANSVNQTETLKKERKSAVSNLVVQGYIIFIVFIIIMIVLEIKILPMVSEIGATSGESLSGSRGITIKSLTPEQFSLPMFVMLLVQSFFAGLVIGKISEGSLKFGIKHSFILLILTLLIKTGSSAFFS